MGRAYIENDLPVEQLNILALREGNSKKPVYRMHKWWARRLSSVFRMILLATFADENVNAGTLWRRFYRGEGLEGNPIVLDPFMGGGTTITEALRLGARVVGVDVNPVAWFITKKQVEPVEIEKLDEAFAELERTVGERIKQMYSTTCPKGHRAEIMYAFWIKHTTCANCGIDVEMWPNHWISRRKDVWHLVCPSCHLIFDAEPGTEKTRCPECGLEFTPANGNSGRGKFTCVKCDHTESILNAVERQSGPLPLRMFGLEYYCDICGRGYKRADNNDHLLLAESIRQFEIEKERLMFPRQPIPIEGRSDPRPVNHGYSYFWQLFNPRQLLALSILLEGISRIEDANIRELMLLAFSDALDANNMFCKYEVDYHKISLLFGLHAYHPIERPTENNVWGTKYGRGTFVKCFQKVRRGKLYGQNPYERAFDGKRSFRVKTGERIYGSPAADFQALLRGDSNAILHAGSSEDLSFLPDRSVDAVVTDPPYFDNVAYSELADFFYVWLRLALKDDYPWFQPDNSWRAEELVQNEKLGRTEDAFTEGLIRIFKEIHRALKDDGLLVFTFHHNQTSAWASLGRALLEAGFVVTAAPVVRSEGKSGFHSDAGNIKYDACLVCRKRASEAGPIEWDLLLEDALSRTARWVKRTVDSGMELNPSDVKSIALAQGLAVYTLHWPGVIRGGEYIGINRALEMLAQAVPMRITFPEGRAEPDAHILDLFQEGM